MPELDGFQATESIRQLQEGGFRSLIIALTASALEGDAERCFSAGMDDYITKPVTLAVLKNVLAKHAGSFAGPAKRQHRRASLPVILDS